MSAEHPFVARAAERHGNDKTPLGEFARDVAPGLPSTGDRAELREALARSLSDAPAAPWTLTCFDVAWKQYRPTCEQPGCDKTVAYQMSLCGEHALADLL